MKTILRPFCASLIALGLANVGQAAPGPTAAGDFLLAQAGGGTSSGGQSDPTAGTGLGSGVSGSGLGSGSTPRMGVDRSSGTTTITTGTTTITTGTATTTPIVTGTISTSGTSMVTGTVDAR